MSIYTSFLKSPKLSKFSRINLGDPVYHKWQCKYPQAGGSDIYCIMVHSCTVESANHKDPVEIIDEFGCPRDSAIPEIIYQNDLTAGLRVGAFSLEFGEVSFYFWEKANRKNPCLT